MEKIISLILTLGIISSNIRFLSSKYSVFAYLASGICFIIILGHKLYKKESLFLNNKILISIITMTFCIQVVSSFKFGINKVDIVPFAAAYIIPIMIYIFQDYKEEDYMFLYKCISSAWLLMEVFLIIRYISLVGFTFDFYKVTTLRGTFTMWPNYFSMFSIVKLGINLLYIKSDKKYYMASNIISFIILTLSQSRTTAILFYILMISYIIFVRKIKINKKQIAKDIIFLIATVIIINFTFSFKASMPNNTISHTIQSRENRWDILKLAIKDNLAIGYGFRSVTTMIQKEYGKNIGSSHNDFIDILFKGGIIYFLFFYGLNFYLFIKSIKYKKYSDGIFIVMIIVAGMVQNPLKSFPFLLIYALAVSKILFINTDKNILLEKSVCYVGEFKKK